MKLRIAGQSLRFRLSRSDVARFIDVGKIEETIYFASNELSFALVRLDSMHPLEVKYEDREILVIVANDIAEQWAREGVGIQSCVETGRGSLDVLIEKDFACLHGDDREKEDTFPNPLETDTTATESLRLPSPNPLAGQLLSDAG